MPEIDDPGQANARQNERLREWDLKRYCGPWLVQQRSRSGLSIAQVAERIGIRPKYLQDVEADRIQCSEKVRQAYEAL